MDRRPLAFSDSPQYRPFLGLHAIDPSSGEAWREARVPDMPAEYRQLGENPCDTLQPRVSHDLPGRLVHSKYKLSSLQERLFTG